MTALARRRGRGRGGARRADRRGPRGDPRARRSPSRPSRSARRSPTTTSRRSSTCWRASAGPAGRWIHFGLTSSDVLDTALALQLRRAGEVIVAGARELRRRARRAGARARGHAVRRPHPRRPRRADLVRAQARRLRDRGAPQRRAPRARVRPGGDRGDLRRGRHLRRRSARTSSARVLDAARSWPPSRSPPRSSRATATPSCCSAIALAGAGLERFATEIRHLQRTEVREVEEPFREGQKGSSAMPHKRNPITTERICGLARVLRGYAQAGAGERRAVARARHLALGRRARRAARRDDPARLHAVLALRVVRGHGRPRRPHARRTSSSPTARCSPSACCSRSSSGGMQRDDAYRLVQRLAQQAWDSGTPLRELLEREAGVDLDLDAVFDYGHYIRHVPEVLARLEATHDLPPDLRAPRATLPDLFHTIPTPIIDPFLYIEDGDRRGATVTVLDAHKVTPHGVEIIDPTTSASTSCSTRGCPATTSSSSCACARASGYGVSARSCRPSSPRRRRPPAAGGIELVVDPEAFATTPAREDRGRDRRHPPRPGRGRRGDGRRRADDPRAGPALTSEDVRAAMQAACDARGCDLPDDVIVSHGAAGRDRARGRPRRDRRRRARDRRHLAARP